MPNQRATNKKQIGMWLTTEELARMDALAKVYKLNRTDLIRALVAGRVGEPVKKPIIPGGLLN